MEDDFEADTVPNPQGKSLTFGQLRSKLHAMEASSGKSDIEEATKQEMQKCCQ